MTFKEDLLLQKTKALQEELENWAHATQILKAGETIVFSLRIEKRPLVRRDPTDHEPFRISAHCRKAFGGVFVHAAKLRDDALASILDRLSSGKVLSQARELLVENRNAPTRLDIDVVRKINHALSVPVLGVCYRVAFGKDSLGEYRAQLWQVSFE